MSANEGIARRARSYSSILAREYFNFFANSVNYKVIID